MCTYWDCLEISGQAHFQDFPEHSTEILDQFMNDISITTQTSYVRKQYTPWAIKKRATLFLIITLAFFGRFLYFLHQWKEEG